MIKMLTFEQLPFLLPHRGGNIWVPSA